jgi:hypothetical protein
LSRYLPPLRESLLLNAPTLKPLRDFDCCREICHPHKATFVELRLDYSGMSQFIQRPLVICSLNAMQTLKW